MEGEEVEDLGFGGYFEQTFDEGATAICQTLCSPCMLCLAIILTFYGEYNYVKDLNNIYTINKDMVDGVTAYSASNDDKPVAYYAAANTVTAGTVTDPLFRARFNNSIALKRKSYMVKTTLTERTSNNRKTTTCSNSWASTKGTAGSSTACSNTSPKISVAFNNHNYASPCSGTNCDGSTIGTTITKTSTGATMFTINQNFLVNDFIGRTTGVVQPVNAWGSSLSTSISSVPTTIGQWVNCNNNIQYKVVRGAGVTGARTGCYTNPPVGGTTGSTGTGSYSGDQTISMTTYAVPATGFTICSKQKAGGTFDVLKSDGNYDIMITGKKTKSQCIDIMEDEAAATVFVFRVIGFACFWIAFCCLFSIVTFLADRIGQLIPCGIGDAFEDMVQCLVCMVTCPPATACWLFWFALAWLIFRPLIGGILFVVSICIGGGIYYAVSQAEGKEKQKEEEDPEEDMATENPQTQMYEQPAEQPPQQQQGGMFGGMMNQAQGYMNQMQQQAPWASDQNTDAAPPVPPPDNNDLNNDGIPDQYQNNLPPGFQAAIDPNSQRVYWINYNTNPPSSQWNDPRAVGPPPPQQNFETGGAFT